MSWIENIKKDFIITLTTKNSAGQSRKVEFKPNWLNAMRVQEYNFSEFVFKGVKGSLVRRQLPLGTRYDIEIYFQGDTNLIESQQFKDFSESTAAWHIAHPMYGQLTAQPIGLKFDDTSYGVTKITGQIIETIGSSLVKVNIDPIDTIQAMKLETDITTATAYEVNVPSALISDIEAMRGNVSALEVAQLAFANGAEAAQAVVNAYNNANAYIDNAADNTFAAIQSIQNMINLPAYFINTIGNRVNFLIQTSFDLYDAITGLTTPRLKRLYESNINTILTTACLASVTNPQPTDYRNRNDVVQIIDRIIEGYNNYITNLDALQTEYGDTPDSYVPDFDSANRLGNLVKYTVSNLFTIASGARQQRTYKLDVDSNWIVLAWQLYGLLPDDSTITQLMDDNPYGLNGILQLKKGTDIIYYV